MCMDSGMGDWPKISVDRCELMVFGGYGGSPSSGEQLSRTGERTTEEVGCTPLLVSPEPAHDHREFQ